MKTSLILLVSILVVATSFAQPSDFIYNRINKTAMKNTSTFQSGDMVRTQGYTTPNDHGGALYAIETNTNNLLDNGGDILTITGTNLIARLIPEANLNVKQFGALCNGTSDRIAIQRAIDFSLNNNLPNLRFPAGIYRIEASLVIRNIGNVTYRRPSGLNLIGTGIGTPTGNGTNSTKIKCLNPMNGPIVKVDGLINGVTSAYINGGSIYGIEFDGASITPGIDQHGIHFQGWWNGTIENCKFIGFNGDAIRHSNGDNFVSTSNPDFTASAFINFKFINVQSCLGYGFNNTVLQGGIGFNFENCIFSFCQKGGAYVQSSSYRFITCAFSGCGFSSDANTSANTLESFGIEFGGTAATANSRHAIEGCEFDNNLTAHIACSRLVNSRIMNNRFIHEFRSLALNAPPKKAIVFAPYNANETIRNLEFSSNFFRIKATSIYPMNNLILFDWVNTANVQNIYIKMNTISDNSELMPNGNSFANIIPFKGYDVNNMHLINNYVIDNREIGKENTIVSFGSPSPYYLGKMSAGQIIPSTGQPFNLIFNQPDPLLSITNFQVAYYDINTGFFTCPYSGYYNLNTFLTLENILHTDLALLSVSQNDVRILESVAIGNSTSQTAGEQINLSLNTKFYASKGDVIKLSLNTLNGGGIVNSPNKNRLSIQLAN